MENKNIIIILVIIIAILVAIAGIMFLNPTEAKESTNIKITSDKELYTDGKLSIQLSDLNKTPISKEIVNITITNKKGKIVVDDVVKTDSKGKATLNLDLKKGKYTVNVTYAGNENYTGSNATQNLTIKEEKQTQEVSSSSSSSTSDEWVYGTGAGASDDPNIHWKRNVKTGYTEYYDENTGRTWGGYNIA